MFKWLVLKRKPRNKSRIDHIIERIGKLDLNNTKKVYNPDLSMMKVMSVCDGIIDYTNLLILLIDNLERDNNIYIPNHNNEIRSMFIKEFYIYKGGYLNTIEATREFLDNSIKLLKVFKNIESLNDKSDTQERNLRVLSKILNNIIDIMEILLTI